MVWLPDAEKITKMFIRFNRTYERDRWTLHDGIGRACVALRGKNE